MATNWTRLTNLFRNVISADNDETFKNHVATFNTALQKAGETPGGISLVAAGTSSADNGDVALLRRQLEAATLRAGLAASQLTTLQAQNARLQQRADNLHRELIAALERVGGPASDPEEVKTLRYKVNRTAEIIKNQRRRGSSTADALKEIARVLAM